MPDRAELHARVERDLTNHPPVSGDVIERFEALRTDAKELAHTLIDLTPACREQSIALTHVEQAVMYAVAAIARNQDDLPDVPDQIDDTDARP